MLHMGKLTLKRTVGAVGSRLHESFSIAKSLPETFRWFSCNQWLGSSSLSVFAGWARQRP